MTHVMYKVDNLPHTTHNEDFGPLHVCTELAGSLSLLLFALSCFLSRGVLQENSVHLISWKLDIAHHGATDETVTD